MTEQQEGEKSLDQQIKEETEATTKFLREQDRVDARFGVDDEEDDDVLNDFIE